MISIYLLLLGLAVGSFLNVLIDRLAKGQKITGRSRCDHCRKQLSGWDLIPVISFITLKGRCRYCYKKLSWQYPIVEILTGILFVLITNNKYLITVNNIFGFWLLVIGYLGIISCLIVIFFSDLKYQIIPDSIQIILFLFSFFLYFISNFGFIWNLEFGIWNFASPFISSVLVMLPILFLYLITKGQGMGFGDVKLAFNIGFLLGMKAGFIALYFAFISGAVWGLILILLRKKTFKSKIAFGPFMVLGTLVMLFAQEKIFSIIRSIYGF